MLVLRLNIKINKLDSMIKYLDQEVWFYDRQIGSFSWLEGPSLNFSPIYLLIH